jgi:hypothetical protein
MNVATVAPLPRSWTLSVLLSQEAETARRPSGAARRPSGLTATPLTEPEWPFSVRSTRPVSRSHTFSASYDVALSFAGEDRDHARRIAELLRVRGFSVFFDENEQATLWGRNLYTHLSDVYQNKARYCLMFISVHYASKLWTKRERDAAQARAFRESREYILPLRLDDTALPGIEETVGYIDLRNTPAEEVVGLLTEKLRVT